MNTYRKRYSNYDSHERVLKSTRAVVGTLETTSTPTALQATLEEGADCYGPFKSMVVGRSASTVPTHIPTADVAIGAPTQPAAMLKLEMLPIPADFRWRGKYGHLTYPKHIPHETLVTHAKFVTWRSARTPTTASTSAA